MVAMMAAGCDGSPHRNAIPEKIVDRLLEVVLRVPVCVKTFLTETQQMRHDYQLWTTHGNASFPGHFA